MITNSRYVQTDNDSVHLAKSIAVISVTNNNQLHSARFSLNGKGSTGHGIS
jgi:hypothetical protein